MRMLLSNTIDWCEKRLAPLFSKMPQLPTRVRTDIVTYLLFIILFIGCINMLQATMGIVYKIARLFFFTPELLTPEVIISVLVNMLVGAVLIISFRLLRNKRIAGWQRVFGITLFTTIINFLYNPLNLIQSGIFIYVLFQTKKEYHQ